MNRSAVHVSTAWRARLGEVTGGGAEVSFLELARSAIKHAAAQMVAEAAANQDPVEDGAVASGVTQEAAMALVLLLSVGVKPPNKMLYATLCNTHSSNNRINPSIPSTHFSNYQGNALFNYP